MRSLCYVSLFLLLAFPLTSGQDHPQAKGQSDNTTQPAGAGERKLPSSVETAAQQGQATSQKKETSAPEEPRPWLTHGEWVMSILTAIYVLATLVYVRISHKTLKAIEDQGKHAKGEAEAGDKRFSGQLKVSQDAANAASLNAQAIISSERPWVLIAVDSAPDFDIPKQTHVYFRGKNWGRTPARITRMCVVSYPHIRDADFPEEPPYHQTELAYPKYVIPGESFPIENFNLSMEWTDAMWEEMSKKKQRLLFVGHVVYFDLFTDKEHTTRFCYFLSPNPGVGLVMTGPRHYNAHT
jgi:hypothetical protein